MKNKKLIMESGGGKTNKKKIHVLQENEIIGNLENKGESMPSKASDIPKIAWSFQNRLAACEGREMY